MRELETWGILFVVGNVLLVVLRSRIAPPLTRHMNAFNRRDPQRPQLTVPIMERTLGLSGMINAVATLIGLAVLQFLK